MTVPAPRSAFPRALSPPAGPPIEFAPPDHPAASIIVSGGNRPSDSLACLRALQKNTPAASFEVALISTLPPEVTDRVVRPGPGLSIIPYNRESDTQKAIAVAIASSVGRYLVLLDDHVEVQPGWLAALLEIADGDPAVGAVGPKVVFPSGQLCEAGAIVWNDGSTWHFGQGREPSHPAFNFRRHVDFCSASALLIRRSALGALSGLDARFLSAPYQAADLCFSLRAAGYSVLYQPEAVVIHKDGVVTATSAAAPPAFNDAECFTDANRHIFAAKWATELDRHWPNGTSLGHRGGRIHHRPRILVADSQVPAHDTDSGGLRMSCIVELLAELGCEITILPMAGLRREPYTTRFQRMGVEVYYAPWAIGDLTRERAGFYDLVLLSRPEVGTSYYPAVRSAFPSARVVYDTVDLHYVREARRLALLGKRANAASRALRHTELQLMRASDIVTTVSEDEALEVQRVVAGARTAVLPNVHDIPFEPPPPYEGRSGMLFIGGFLHNPNVDAMTWFVHEVMPAMEGMGSRLVVLGSDPPPAVLALGSRDVLVTGYIPDVEPFFREAAVFICPLRYGAGLKGKVGQAMSLGLPVVTTTVGAEGMGMVDGVHGLVRDDPLAFAAAVAEVAADPDLWQRLSRGGLELVRSTLSRDCMRARLRELLADSIGYRTSCQAPAPSGPPS